MVTAGDFRQISLGFGELGSLEKVHRIAKARQQWAFLLGSGVVSPTAGLLGWSERIRTHAFPIELGLWVGLVEFGNIGRQRPI
jgi:hypothetical protein